MHGGVTLSHDPAANLSEQILRQGADDAAIQLGQGCGFGMTVWVRPASGGALAWPRRTFIRSVSGESLFLPRGGVAGLRTRATQRPCVEARVSRGGWRLVGPVRARGGVVHNGPLEETARGGGEPLGGDEIVGGRP